MKIEQEPKYCAICEVGSVARIVNRASGEAIPDDEPVFIFRARDRHAVSALKWYAGIVTNGSHEDAINNRIADFEAFRRAHPERMKEPDTAVTDEGR